MNCIVVTFGGPAEGYCTLSHCPLDAYGPFPSRDTAGAFAATLPERFQPHILQLTPPEEGQR